jgi:ribonuclease D
MRRMSREPTAGPPSEFVNRISRVEMSELPIRRYEGSVHIVAGPPDLQHAMQDILHEGVVGFDTETRPAFRSGESYPPSLVQFATAGAVYLWQVQQQDLFGALREILSSEQVVKVGVSVTDDVRNLKKDPELRGRYRSAPSPYAWSCHGTGKT